MAENKEAFASAS